MKIKDLLKLLLSPVFYEDIKDIEIVNSFFIKTSKIFVIKILPIGISFILTPTNQVNQNVTNLIKEDVLSAITLKDIKTEIYKKTTHPTKIFSKNYLIVLLFENYQIISNFELIEKILTPLLKQTSINLSSQDLGELEKEISKAIDNAFLSISGIPWDLDEFFYFIDKVSLQFILSKLLQVSSEDEITTLVLTLRKSGNRIKENISSRAWERIQLLSKEKEEFLKQNSKWVESALFGFSIKINHILQEEIIPFSSKLKKIRESITKSFYLPRIENKTLSRAIYLLPKSKSINDILKYTDRTSLAKALVGIEKPLIEKLSLGLSEKGKNLLLEDVNFFTTISQDYSKEKIKLLDGIIKLLFEQEYENEINTIMNIVDKLNNLKIYYAINLTDTGSFLLFLEKINTKKTKETLKKFLDKTQGPIRTTAELFLNKLMKLTYIYGDTMINERSKNFIEKLYFTVKTDELLF